MSIIETVAVFAGIPAAVIVVVAGLVYGGSARRARRYRPGRPFEFAPVWFLSAPEQDDAGAAPEARERALSGANRLALSKGDQAAAGPASTAAALHEATGGASDRW